MRVKKWLWLVALTGVICCGGNELRNNVWESLDENGIPSGWKITVTRLRSDARPPDVSFKAGEKELSLFAGQGGCEVTLHQPGLRLRQGKYVLSFSVSGAKGCSFRGVLMYQVVENGKAVWKHSQADWMAAPIQKQMIRREFDLPDGIGNAYLFLAVRGIGSANFSDLGLERKPEPAAFQPIDPATLWKREDVFAVPRFEASPYPGSEANGLRAVVLDSRPDQGKPSKIFAYIAIPEGKAPKEGYPAVVLAHGGNGTAFAEYARQWMRRGYAVIAPDLYGKRPDAKNPNHSVEMPGGIYRLDEWVVRSAEAIMRAHSLLRSLPKVDPTRIALVGVSWGGVFSAVAAATDSRFKGVVCVYGCGYWSEGNASLIFSRWKNASWDPKYFLKSAKVPLYWVAGTNDLNFGVQPWQYSAEAAPTTANRTLIAELPHGHRGFLFGAVTRTVDALLRGGTPLPKLGTLTVTDNVVSAPILERGKGIVSVELLYTLDCNPCTEKRKWQTLPAQVKFETVTARLPQGVVQCCLTAADEIGRGENSTSCASRILSLH